MSGPAIDIRGLDHVYATPSGARAVLRGLDLEVAAGDVVVLTGTSGAGKTTLLTLCGALRSVQRGELEVLGTPLGGLDAEGRRRLRSVIGFVFQSHNLIDALTAGQNVVMSLLGRLPREQAAVRAQAALAALGLADRIDALPEALSGGEKQRVAVARALVREPRLMLADEPTASLDDASAATVVDAIRAHATRHACGVVVATHDTRVFAIADRIVRLGDGVLTDVPMTTALCGGSGPGRRPFALAG